MSLDHPQKSNRDVSIRSEQPNHVFFRVEKTSSHAYYMCASCGWPGKYGNGFRSDKHAFNLKTRTCPGMSKSMRESLQPEWLERVKDQPDYEECKEKLEALKQVEGTTKQT